MEYLFLVILICLLRQSKVEDMLKCAVPFFKPSLFFNYDFFWLWMQSDQSYTHEYIDRMTYQADGEIVTARFQISFL